MRDGQNPFAKIKGRKKASKPVTYVSIDEYRALMNATQLEGLANDVEFHATCQDILRATRMTEAEYE